MMQPKDILALLFFVGLCFGAAALGSYFTQQSLGPWYFALKKPSWTPSGSTIGAVWTVLYAMIGVSGFLVWRKGGFGEQAVPFMLYFVQLILNVLWSAVFFGMKSPGTAFLEIVLLWVAILLTVIAFYHSSKLAAALLVPYLAWVTFAAGLNYVIWNMNS